MASSRKKVVVRRFTPGPLWGYLPPFDLSQGGVPDALALLDLSGKVQAIPLLDVKYVAWVRDFNTADTFYPERLARKTFLGRPRTEGLWLRLALRDGELIEGLAPLDITFADAWTTDRGVYLIPPDIRGNTQRLFVPRAAIETMETLAVVTTPSRRKLLERTTDRQEEPDLFSLPLPPDARTN